MQSENERDAFVSAAFCCEVVESAHVKCRRCRSLFFIFFFLFVPFFPFLFLCGLTFNFTKGNNGCCQGGCSFRFGCFTFVSFFFCFIFVVCSTFGYWKRCVSQFQKKENRVKTGSFFLSKQYRSQRRRELASCRATGSSPCGCCLADVSTVASRTLNVRVLEKTKPCFLFDVVVAGCVWRSRKYALLYFGELKDSFLPYFGASGDYTINALFFFFNAMLCSWDFILLKKKRKKELPFYGFHETKEASAMCSENRSDVHGSHCLLRKITAD